MPLPQNGAFYGYDYCGPLPGNSMLEVGYWLVDSLVDCIGCRAASLFNKLTYLLVTVATGSGRNGRGNQVDTL